jgi:hypothetical protein
MDQSKSLLLLANDPRPSWGRILRIILAKAIGGYILLFAAWYLWIFGASPVMEAYELIAEQKRILTGTQPSLFGTLHDLFTASGAYSFLADASFYLYLIGIAACMYFAFRLVHHRWILKRTYVRVASYQAAGFAELHPDLSSRE